MRNKDHGTAAVGHFTERKEQLLHLLRRQHGRRLVQNQDVCIAVQHLQDFYPLLLADRQLPRQRAGINLDAIALGKRLYPRLQFFLVDDLDMVVAQNDVFCHVKRLYQLKMLIDHADSVLERILRCTDHDRLAVDTDLPRIGLQHAGQDAHQRTLSRTVLAEQSVNFAAVGGEVHIIIGEAGRKLFADPPHLHSCFCHCLLPF